jgi:hypothetical protein
MVPRLPSKSVRAEAARPLIRGKGSRAKADGSSPAPSLLSLANRFQPIENAQMPTIANSVGRMKLYAMDGTIPSNLTGVPTSTNP